MPAFIELDNFYKILSRTPGQGGEAAQFNVFRIEDFLLAKHKSASYSRRNFYKISLITGHGKIHYADQCIEIKESALVFTNPMIPYFWERISEKQTGYFCVFTETFFSRFESVKDFPVFQFSDTAIIPLNKKQLAAFKNLFVKMYEELQGNYEYKYNLVRHLLMEVIHDAQKMQPAKGTHHIGANASERIASLFTELLERQFPIELVDQKMIINAPAAFASQLNVHVNHLNKALKEITNRTTSQLINDRIAQEARILLKSTTWTIAAIAWSLGFEEPNHFSSFFKKWVKMTPNQFRQAG